MKIIGIIAEYNPFHNGHLYQINKIKELYPDSLIAIIVSSCFCERGEVSILNKWDKTKIALENGADIVVELPFVFSSQSADIFAHGAIETLNYLNIDYLCFGSESNDLEKLNQLANIQIENKDYDKMVKKYLKEGINYPTALSKALQQENFNQPNDLLAISYLKEIIKNKYDIKALSIKRTNDYHNQELNNNIVSATAIRKAILEDKNIDKYIPNYSSNIIYKNIDYFNLLKYKILSDKNILNTFQTVDEGIENRILKVINKCNNIEELILNIKTKRYTYNKINRMLIHILTSFTKEEAQRCKNIEYIRILGFNDKGKKHLNKIKKKCEIPIISNYKNINSEILDIEYRINLIYSIIVNDESLIKKELDKPIII